jgi:hypothetical protein
MNKRDCDTCVNKCMDMDMDPYCAAVNKPWGRVLFRGIPEECGPTRKLWSIDTRREVSADTERYQGFRVNIEKTPKDKMPTDTKTEKTVAKAEQRFTEFEDLSDQATVDHLVAMAKRMGEWIQSQPEAGGDWVAATTILLAMAIKNSQANNINSAIACKDVLNKISFLFAWAWERSEIKAENDFIN